LHETSSEIAPGGSADEPTARDETLAFNYEGKLKKPPIGAAGRRRKT
jgi:hypothetical protein